MSPSIQRFCRFVVATSLCVVTGCSKAPAPERSVAASVTPSSVETGDATRGLAVIERFECVRCHAGLLGVPAAPPEKRCVDCHRDILAGRYDAPRASMAHWQRDLQHWIDVPSLTQSSVRLRKSFLRKFLLNPVDLRPSLDESMPKLALTEADAADIAALLGGPEDREDRAHGNRERGERLFSIKGCSNCHAVGNAERPPMAEVPVTMAREARLRGIRLAPDLGFTSQRATIRSMRAWLQAPSAIKPDSAMPDIPLSSDEIDDLVTYIQSLSPPAQRSIPFVRRPTERAIAYEEVERRVFRKGCWHCHSDPDFAYGDGGPGNTGGFGYPGKGIVLSHWEGIHGGSVAPDGKRQSLLQPSTGKPPRLLLSLLARRKEEEGHPVDGVLGMPLGLPSLSDDENRSRRGLARTRGTTAAGWGAGVSQTCSEMAGPCVGPHQACFACAC
ncbi:MAG: c-type cytochrome [Polyangiaceae bacterium]